MYLKKYINLLSKLFCCFAFALLVCFTLNYDEIKKSNAYNNDNVVTAYDDITNLTGTTWTFNDNASLPDNVSGWYYFVNFISNDITFENFLFNNWTDGEPVRPMGQCELVYDSTTVASGVIGSNSFNYWLDNSYKTITFIDGSDVSNRDLIYLVTTMFTPVQTGYNVTINLGDGLYGSTSATIEENSTLTLTYSVLNNGVFGGYVFDYGSNLLTDLTYGDGNGHVSVSGGYDEITLTISDVTDNIAFKINSVPGQSMIGKWYLDYNLFLNSGLESIDVDSVLSRPFSSNGRTFNRIYRNKSLNTFVYDDTTDFESPIVNLFSFLTGLYLPVDTYNYLLIDIASDPSGLSYDYVPSSFMFFKFFRPATNEDIARVNQLNEHLIIQKENTNFISLFGAILDTQFGTLKSLLNFYIFDVNFYALITFAITLALVFFVIKTLKGGKKDE